MMLIKIQLWWKTIRLSYKKFVYWIYNKTPYFYWK